LPGSPWERYRFRGGQRIANFRAEATLSTLKIAIPAALLFGGILICTSASYGKAEYTKTTKKACTFCHTKAAGPDLNDTGKYYAEHKELPPAKK
jgi:hypothetical protein